MGAKRVVPLVALQDGTKNRPAPMWYRAALILFSAFGIFQIDLAAVFDVRAHRLDLAGVHQGQLGQHRADQLIDEDGKERDVADQVALGAELLSLIHI